MTDSAWDMTSAGSHIQNGDDLTQAVQNAVPIETYDESLLVTSLERTNVTGQSSRMIDQAIPMPPTEGDSMDEHDNGEDHAAKTVEETLFDLNYAIHQDHQPGKKKDSEAATTQADAFAANDGSMFRRAGGYGASIMKSKKNVNSDDVETGTIVSKSQKHLGSMAHSAQHHAKKHMKENIESSSGYQEMKKLIATNKNQMRSYTRNVILFLILPATAAAFL